VKQGVALWLPLFSSLIGNEKDGLEQDIRRTYFIGEEVRIS
jgi:hypothetical protein